MKIGPALCSGGENAEDGDFIALGLRDRRVELRLNILVSFNRLDGRHKRALQICFLAGEWGYSNNLLQIKTNLVLYDI